MKAIGHLRTLRCGECGGAFETRTPTAKWCSGCRHNDEKASGPQQGERQAANIAAIARLFPRFAL